MKKSTIILIALVAVYLLGVGANLIYHKANYENQQWRISEVGELSNAREKITVVILADKTGELQKMIEVGFDNNPHWTIKADTALLSDFCRAYSIKGDTMRIDGAAISPEKGESIALNLPFAGSVYCNGKLIKKLTPQRRW